MQKKSSLIILCLFFINFVSAAYYGSLQTFINRINPSILIIGALFLIFFAFLNYVLSKIFKDKYGEPNKATAGIISLCISALIVYGMRNFLDNLTNWFYGFGISETVFWIFGIVAFIVISIFIIKWLRICGFLMIVGTGLIIISFTELIYQKWFVGIIGALFIILGIWCFKKNLRYPQGRSSRLLTQALGPSSKRGIGRRTRNSLSAGVNRIGRGINDSREARRANKLEEARMADQQRKYQKMVRHLQKLSQQKQMELQKQQMLHAKGVKGAKRRIRTLESELIEISRRMTRYS